MHSYPLIEQFRRPILASFRQKVEEIPDRGKEVNTPVVWVAVWPGVKRGFGRVKMMDFAIRFAAEHADARMLSSVTFDLEIRIETRLAARQQPDFVPSPAAGPLPEFPDFHFGHQYKICFLADMRSDRIVCVGPHRAHKHPRTSSS